MAETSSYEREKQAFLFFRKFYRADNESKNKEDTTMSYSSESCMVSREEAKKITIREIMNKERRKKMKEVFDKYMERRREALYEIALDHASK